MPGLQSRECGNMGSQLSRSPSKTSVQSLMHFVSRRPTVIPTMRASQTALRSPLPALPPHSQGKHHQISQVPPQAGRDKQSIIKAALECWQRWKMKVTVPPTFQPMAMQDSVRTCNYWSPPMLHSEHITFTFCQGCLQELDDPPVQPSEPMHNQDSERSTFSVNTGQLPCYKHVKSPVPFFFSTLSLVFYVV